MTTMEEPEWDQATRDLVLGLDAVDLCGVCGGPAYLCQDPARQDDYTAGDPIRCHATTARLMKQRGFSEESNPGVAALWFPVYLTRRAGA